MFGIGEYSIGGFPDSDSLSESNLLVGILSSNQIKREYLLRASLQSSLISTDDDLILITDEGESISTEDTQTIDLSTGGYVSKVYDDPYKLFPGCISTAYSFSAELSTSDFLSGGATTSGGEIKIKNINGRLDNLAVLDWLGADLQLFIGTKDLALSQFTNFCKGVSSGINKQFDSFSILQKDHRFKLKKPLHKHRYMGVDSCIRSFTGSLCNVNFGDVLDRGADSFAVQILFKGNTLTTEMYLVDKMSTSGLSIKTDTSNNILTILTDGTFTSTITSPIESYLDNRLHRLTLSVDRLDLSQTLWIDDTIIGYEPLNNVGSISNAANLRLGSKSDATKHWRGYFDDFRMWKIPLTKSQISSHMHRELRATEINSADLDCYVPFNERGDLTAYDIRTGSTISGTLSNINGWSGSLEGDATISTNVKPILVGVKRNIKPILVDPFGLVYQWHDDLGDSIIDVTIAGDEFTFQSEVSDIYSVTPDVDKYTIYRGSDGSYFRLGSEPTGEVLISAQGDASLTGYVSSMPDIHKRVILKWGNMLESELDMGSYITLSLRVTHSTGFYFTDEIKTDEALDIIVKDGGFGWWGPGRLGLFSIGRIENPDSIVPSVILNRNHFVDPNKGGTFSIQPIGVRIGKLILGYRRYGQTLTVDQLSTSLSQSQIDDKGKEYRFVEYGVSSGDDDTVTVYTEIDNEEDAQNEVIRLWSIWSVNRFMGRFTLKTGALSYFIGSDFIAQNGRYELSEAKKCISFGIHESMGVAGSTDRLDVALFF